MTLQPATDYREGWRAAIKAAEVALLEETATHLRVDAVIELLDQIGDPE